jgi:ABC-type branched-subunit amino acid transport system substrate-binding protein
LVAACSPGGRSDPTLGPITGNQPVTGETIGTGSVKVAMLLPLSATGNAGTLANHLKNAAALALKDFPSADIQILVKDDRGTADGARAAATEAIQQGAQLILGPLFAASASAAGQVARGANVPVIAFSTDSNVATRGVYLLSFMPQSDVERIIQYAASRGKHSVAALLPANGYGSVVEAALQRAVAARGMRIVSLDRYELDRVSMQSKAEALADVVKKGQADTVFIPDAGDAAPFLAQVLSSQGVFPGKAQFLGSGQWNGDQRVLGESNLFGAWYPAPDNTGFEGFAAKYRAAYGDAPLRPASLGYDAASLAAGLVSRGGGRISADAITNPNGFAGVDGAFRLMPDGTNQRALAVYEIGRGSAKQVDPAPREFRAGF